MLQNSAFMSNAKLGFHVRRKSQVLQQKKSSFPTWFEELFHKQD
jgi:hypothetical protein